MKQQLEYVDLRHQHTIDGSEFGERAARLARLAGQGHPIPRSFAIGASSVQSIGGGTEFAVDDLLAEFDPDGLIILRSSPASASWGGVKSFTNIGLNSRLAGMLAGRHDQAEVWALFAEFVQEFAVEVDCLDAGAFDSLAGMDDQQDTQLRAVLDRYREWTGESFPDSRACQLGRVLRSMANNWYETSARYLRKAKGAPDDAALGLIVQECVSTLIGPTNATGRVSAVDRATGKRMLSGSCSFRREGSLVGVDGLEHVGEASNSGLESLPPLLDRLRTDFADDQEVDFALRDGRLWLLDCRPVHRSPSAAIRTAVSLVDDGIIDRKEALLRIDPDSLARLIHPQLDADCANLVLARGSGASPGAVSGAIVFSSAAAEQCRTKGESCILVRVETGPEDIRGMHTANGVLTGRGGLTSHAAVIARGLGVPCVAGASDLQFDAIRQRLISHAGRILREGDIITVDGASGLVLDGAATLIEPRIDSCFSRFLDWADSIRRLQVRANADTLDEARVASLFQADGIGLCRTEHMFFEGERLTVMREMIFAESAANRRRVLDKLLPMQRNDFIALLHAMTDRPVCIRLFDPPLHEFLPRDRDEISNLAVALDLSENDIVSRADELKEFNPMLGLRGVRLGIVVPEIYEMQARAIFEATVAVNREGGNMTPEIMIPLVSANREVELIKSNVSRIAESVQGEQGVTFEYRLGVMVETPRAALRAGDLALNSEFLSFGTNDLTQLTYGISRDDANRFMNAYVDQGVYLEDPFRTLDREGVGELLTIAAERGRQARKSVTLSICGEHGGDAAAIEFCDLAGFDYVSCSPYRVPIARLAAAQCIARAELSDRSPS